MKVGSCQPVRATWLPHIEKPMEPVRRVRGQQLRPLLCGSICSGMEPAKEVFTLLKYDVEYEFSCDNDPAAFMFCQEHHQAIPDKHYFVEAMQFTEGCEWAGLPNNIGGHCAIHEGKCVCDPQVQSGILFRIAFLLPHTAWQRRGEGQMDAVDTQIKS